jgi:hypothetical protein
VNRWDFLYRTSITFFFFTRFSARFDAHSLPNSWLLTTSGIHIKASRLAILVPGITFAQA